MLLDILTDQLVLKELICQDKNKKIKLQLKLNVAGLLTFCERKCDWTETNTNTDSVSILVLGSVNAQEVLRNCS